jgi:hypothetical protein
MRARLLLFVTALAALGLHAAWFAASWTDDAYITMRYARRFGTGEGMTFNPGEHFEGITNLGWALLLAPWADGDLFTVAQVLGALAGVGALACLGWWGRHLAPTAYFCALASLVAPAWLPSWMMQGLETAGVTFVLTAGWVAYLAAAEGPRESPSGERQGRLVLAGLALGLGPWLRPDAAVLPLVLGVWHVWARRVDVRSPRSWPWAAIVPIVVSAVVLVGVKLVWFGEVLPNTFHLKVDHFPPDRGLRYLWSWFTRPAPWLPLVSLASLIRAGYWARDRDPRAVPGLVFAVYLITGTLQNGDFMPNFRFFTPAWPAGAAAIGLLAQDLAERTRWWGLRTAGLFSLTLIPPSHVFLMDRLDAAPGDIANMHPTKEAPFVFPWRSAVWGTTLPENVPFPAAWAVVNAGPTDTVAYTELGLFSYVYDGAVVDLLGLTDRVIAGRDGQDLTAKWAYIQGRVNWLIVDTHLPAWNRWAGHLAASKWTVVGGCSENLVFANPTLPGVGPTAKERAAALERARRRAGRQAGFLTALENELLAKGEPVGEGSAASAGMCGTRERRADPARFVDASVWPAHEEEAQGFGSTGSATPREGVERPKADPKAEPPPSDTCVETQRVAAAAWDTAAGAWAKSVVPGAAEARRNARSASRAAMRPDALTEAEYAVASARALPADPAAAASEAALLASRAAASACAR